jgi:myosin heavy subunit
MDSALRRAEEEASNLAECSQEYMTRVQELNSKITILTKTVAETSKGSEEFARKYQLTLDQCEVLERERDSAVASVESMEGQVHSYAARMEQTTGLLSATLAALYQLKEDYLCAKQIVKVWAADSDISRLLLVRNAGKRLPAKHPLLKFRSCVIVVLAHNRLLKLQKGHSNVSLCGISIPAAEYSSNLQDFLAEAAPKQPRAQRDNIVWRLGTALTRSMQMLGLRKYGVTISYLASVMEEHVQKLTAVVEAKVKE